MNETKFDGMGKTYAQFRPSYPPTKLMEGETKDSQAIGFKKMMSEIIIGFHEHEHKADELMKFAVIMTRHNNQWLYCRHKERDTYEIPGGHREKGLEQ